MSVSEFWEHLTALAVPILTASPVGDDYRRPLGWQKSTADGNAERIAAWSPGDAVLGLLGGTVAVVDVDTKNGADVEQVRQLLDGIGCRIYAEVITPSGGRHFYVPGSDDLPSVAASADRDGLTGYPGVEVLSHRHNVFLPGTRRAKYDGAGYAILSDDLATLADGGDEDSAEALVGWVSEHWAAGSREQHPVSPPWDGTPPDARQRAYLDATLRNVAERVAGTARGGRNDAVYVGGLVLGNYIAGAGLDVEQATTALLEAAARTGLVADEGEKSVRATIRSGLRAGAKRPRAVPGVTNVPPAPSVEPESGEGVSTATDAPIEDDPAERARRLFPRLDWHALWADDSEEEWIHHPLLPARRLVTIYSPPKIGKSLLVLELAVAISRGEIFLGHRPEKRFRVLYVDYENDPRGDIRSRLQAMGYRPDDLDHLDYLSFPALSGLDTERGALELIEAVKAYGSEVVLVDTVSRAVDGEENSNDTWLGLYRHTGLRLKQMGVAMLRLDHSGKDETRGTRGGSAKSGDVDAIWKLSKVTEQRFRLECSDARMQLDTKTLHLVRQTSPKLSHVLDGASAELQQEARVRELAELCDANDLPADAGRKDVADFLRGRGIKGRTELFADVAKRRKEAARPAEKLSPTLGDSPSGQAVPDDLGQPGHQPGEQAEIPQNDADSPCPDQHGDNRGQQTSAPVPVSVPHVVGTDGRGTGQDSDEQQIQDDLTGLRVHPTTGEVLDDPDDRPQCADCSRRLGKAEAEHGICTQCHRKREAS